MTEQELLPCPICGCDAEVSGESEYTEIDCGNGRCECFGECFDRETWNDRAKHCESLRLRVAELEEVLRFYADEKKYILLIKDKKAMEKFTDKYGDSVEADHGEMARKALEGK
jgi:hypothetical protein